MTTHLFPSRPRDLHEAIWKDQRNGGYSIAALRRFGYKVSFMRNFCLLTGYGTCIVLNLLERKCNEFPSREDGLRYVELQMYNWRNNVGR